jgi:hypothetical protein
MLERHYRQLRQNIGLEVLPESDREDDRASIQAQVQVQAAVGAHDTIPVSCNYPP